MRQRLLAGGVLGLALLVTACSSGDGDHDRPSGQHPSPQETKSSGPEPRFQDVKFTVEGAQGKECYHSVVGFDDKGPVVRNHDDGWSPMSHHDLDIHSCPDGVTLTIAWGGRKVTGKMGMRSCERAVTGENGNGPGVDGVAGVVNEMPLSSLRPGDQFCEFNEMSSDVHLFRLQSVNRSTSETTWTATEWFDLDYTAPDS
ncbi:MULTISPECIES: hypothetical protein [Streptomyces]|uniref:Lipoprotein n=1 Tax=Streptomyces canarius TaxID=285453 RepID=A0ABQ3DEL7_9ACTN|nr:hypothetical protein [Streptomyces canarius]GHA72128.1 hypothetical protein GCM10010345_88890 [Streptomyces canarius]